MDLKYPSILLLFWISTTLQRVPSAQGQENQDRKPIETAWILNIFFESQNKNWFPFFQIYSPGGWKYIKSLIFEFVFFFFFWLV